MKIGSISSYQVILLSKVLYVAIYFIRIEFASKYFNLPQSTAPYDLLSKYKYTPFRIIDSPGSNSYSWTVRKFLQCVSLIEMNQKIVL